MKIFPLIFGVILVIAACYGNAEVETDSKSDLDYSAEETPQGKRPARALPSVSADHYSEVLADGTYKYAYTGEHRYVAERRLSDGTVEGESLYVRPDGVPIKVHYFADKEGYRPKTEVLYNERVVSTRRAFQPSIIREVVPVQAASPPIILSPPKSGENSVNVNLGDLSGLGIGIRSGSTSGRGFSINSQGGDVAIAQPSVTAIVGPGGHAVVRPEAIARSSSGGSHYFRTSSSSGDVAIANPMTTAIVGAGGSVVVEPRAAAYAGGGQETIRELHHHTTQQVVTPVERVIHTQPVREVRVQGHPVPVFVERRGGYNYSPPIQPAAVAVPVSPYPQGTIHSVRGAETVLVVPPSSRYSYSYGYSAPDPKHPQRDNSAYVTVQVNQ